jgi:hypothetical protein
MRLCRLFMASCKIYRRGGPYAFRLRKNLVPSRAWNQSSACQCVVRCPQACGIGFPNAAFCPAHKAIADGCRWTIFGASNRTSDSRLLSTCTIPLMTRESSARSTPRTSLWMSLDPSPLLIAETKKVRAHGPISPFPKTNQDRIVGAEQSMSFDPN